MHELFSVEQLATQANVTPRTVRLYVERGLLNPLRAGRTLCFTPTDAKELEAILRAKRLGFSLKEIKHHLNDPSPEALAARRKRVCLIKTDADRELAALERNLKCQPKDRS